jgi:hypothetical protein
MKKDTQVLLNLAIFMAAAAYVPADADGVTSASRMGGRAV